MNDTVYFDLLEAFQQTGCPVCWLVQRDVERSLAHFFYESVNDPDIRARLRKSLGFCRTHAWLSVNARVGDALGIAIIYQDILTNLLRDLPSEALPEAPEDVRTDPKIYDRLLRRTPFRLKKLVDLALKALTPRQRCPGCEQEEISTRLAIETLVKSLRKTGFIHGLKASGGLCIPHLKLALKQVHDPSAYTVLLEISRENLDALRAELAEFIRKNDYRFREEPVGPEGNSWKRAVARVVGEQPGE